MGRDFITVLRGIVKAYLDNLQPADLAYGTYTGGGVKIDNKPLSIPAGMVDVPERLRKLTGEDALKSGDRVAVLQKQGGQRYYILDRL